MRISENRYRRERQSVKIAMCFLAFEARTQTIQTWTGLSGNRVRKLYREYMITAPHSVVRPRGKSPRRAAYFWAKARVRQEAAWFASLLTLVGVIRRGQSRSHERPFPDLENAELLCLAYEIFRSMIPSTRISFEHAAFLTRALWNGAEIQLSTCPKCGGLVIVDPLSIYDNRCAQCSETG